MCVTHLVHLYRSEVHNDVCSNDHEANEERSDPQVEGFLTQPLRAFVVLLIVALLGLRCEGKIKFSFMTSALQPCAAWWVEV